MHAGEGIRTIKLADDKSIIVPKSIWLINPQKEGKTKYLYFFWTTNDEGDMGFEHAGTIYGWFSDFDFLHIFGVDNTRVVIPKSATDKIKAYKDGRDEVHTATQYIINEALMDNPEELEGTVRFICCWMKAAMFQEQPCGYMALEVSKSNK